MTRISLRTALALVALALLVIGWAVLFKQSRAVDVTAQSATLGTIQQARQLDAEWNADLLRSQADLIRNYDPLVSPLTKLVSVAERLGTDAKRGDNAEAATAVKAYEDAVKAKSQLVDQFKTQNAVLKNSLRYLPTAREEIAMAQGGSASGRDGDDATLADSRRQIDALERELASGAGNDAERGQRTRATLAQLRARLANASKVSAAAQAAVKSARTDTDLSTLVSETFRFNTLADAESAQSVKNLLDRVRKQNEAQGATPARETMQNLFSHVEAVLRERVIQANLLRQIAAVPVGERLAAVDGAFSKQFADESSEQATYQRILLFYSGLAVLAILGGVAYLVYRNRTERNRLEQMVHEKTAALREAEARLVHSEKMSTMGEVVAGIAHEINTPLGYLRSGLETVREQLTDTVAPLITETGHLVTMARNLTDRDVIRAQFQKVMVAHDKATEMAVVETADGLLGDGVEGVAHIHDTVVNLLNFSRLDQSRVSTANLKDGVESTLRLARQVTKDRVIVTEFADDRPIRCDMSQLNQVFLNLIRNAVQATEPGTGKVTIRTENLGTAMVRLTVSDNGHGIAPDVLPKIFDAFFSTKRDGAGTGLGLSISKKVVEAHGGTISVDSAVGNGTRFTVDLPVNPPDTLTELNDILA